MDPTSTYLTTRELAELLRIKERKVYDLAASGEVPCARAMGKLLFPRREIEAWLVENSTGPGVDRKAERSNVFLGSHDPLLEWALLQSRCGIATFFDGSLDGLDRFAAREGVAAGLHLFDAATGTWNTNHVASRFAGQHVVMIEWAVRQRGLVVRPDARDRIGGFDSIAGLRVVPRQPESGSQKLFEHLSAQAGLSQTDFTLTTPAHSESDAALAVFEDRADVAFGLAAMAHQYRLAFVPIVTERFDILVDRRAWFEPSLQALLSFCGTEGFAAKRAAMPGYETKDFGRVHFNA